MNEKILEKELKTIDDIVKLLKIVSDKDIDRLYYILQGMGLAQNAPKKSA